MCSRIAYCASHGNGAEYLVSSFPFGKGPTVLLFLAMISGGWLLFNPPGDKLATLHLWSFALTHLNSYKKVISAFEAAHPGVSVDMQLVHPDAVTHRLRAAFWADLDVPDLAEVEISSAGTFFRGPLEEVGFLDLKPWLISSGYYQRILHSRLAPYSNRGCIYGLPKAVCPVMLAYRKDLFEEMGVDLTEINTWEEFIALGRQLTVPDQRYAIELSDSNSSQLEMFLFQRGGGFFNEDGELIFDNEIGLETLKWYIPLVAGPDRIGTDLAAGRVFTQALEKGYFLTFLCPDWRSKTTEIYVPRVAGKMALRPLPVAFPGGRRTSTQGGTMLAISKKSPHRDLALQAAEQLYLQPDELAQRFQETNIIPPLRDAWPHSSFDRPDPYWSGQPVGRLYVNLAEEVPPQYTSPYVSTAKQKLGEAVSSCAAYYRSFGPTGFEGFAERTLREAADSVRFFMARNRF